MAGILLFIHLTAASIWVGGHLVLAISVLPEALRNHDPEPIRSFERIFERIGLPAIAIQVTTGLWLSHRLLPDMATWMEWSNPVARTVGLKLVCLVATLALAIHARLRIMPKLNADRLPLLSTHIIAVTTLAVLFVWLGVCFRYGGV